MELLEEDVVHAAAALEIPLRTLDARQARRLLMRLRERYGTRPPKGRRLWEELGTLTGIRDPEGWSFVDHLCGSGPVFLLVEENGVSGYEFDSGLAVKEVLANLFGFEFYLTDESLTYIIAFNDHDVLIIGGTAAERASACL